MKLFPSLTSIFMLMCSITLHAQQDSLPQKKQGDYTAEDPGNFFSRLEFFNKLTALRNGEFVNSTTARSIFNLGKGFTTRIDIPLVYNSFAVPGIRQFGLGDISIRALGYKLNKKPKSVIVASIEMSFNTASSPLLGTGKNIIIPQVSYSSLQKSKRSIIALSVQQFISFSGNKARQDINFTRLQAFFIHLVTPRSWYVIRPEWYFDYKNDGVAMNLEALFGHALSRKTHIWFKSGAGIFGSFTARYKWNMELGYRYMLRKNPLAKQSQ